MLDVIFAARLIAFLSPRLISGQPDNSPDMGDFEACASQEEGGLWWDKPCVHEYTYICKRTVHWDAILRIVHCYDLAFNNCRKEYEHFCCLFGSICELSYCAMILILFVWLLVRAFKELLAKRTFSTCNKSEREAASNYNTVIYCSV